MKRAYFLSIPVLVLLATSFLLLNACDYITGEAIELSFQTQTPEQIIKDVSVTEAYTVIALNAGHANFTIIDVRTPDEYADGHISGAINRDFNSPTFRVDIVKFDKDNIYLVYCRSGSRSTAALNIMKELGFQQIYNVSGGITAWIAHDLPLAK